MCFFANTRNQVEVLLLARLQGGQHLNLNDHFLGLVPEILVRVLDQVLEDNQSFEDVPRVLFLANSLPERRFHVNCELRVAVEADDADDLLATRSKLLAVGRVQDDNFSVPLALKDVLCPASVVSGPRAHRKMKWNKLTIRARCGAVIYPQKNTVTDQFYSVKISQNWKRWQYRP